MQTIGERLEDARKQKGISIREAAESTKIRGEYLQKFESNHFDIELSNIYVRGFLRTYANFLKLPADRLLNDYAALGGDEPRVRQPSREVYGRMDLSVASANERATGSSEDTAAEAQRAQAKYSRGRSNLPAEPFMDPALVLKIGKIAAGVIAIVLVIWGAKVLFSGDKPSSASHGANSITVAPTTIAAPTITLIALETVTVKVASVADGRELFQGTIARGQTQVVPWPGELYITASMGENLQIEASGKRFGVGFRGYNRAKLPAVGGL